MSYHYLELFVFDDTSDTVWNVATEPDGDKFMLPKSQVVWGERGDRTDFYTFGIPNWLWLRHRQLCGDEAYDAEKARLAKLKGKK